MNAYLTVGDSYFYVKRQLIFLTVGVLGALAIMKLPPSTLRLLELVRCGSRRHFVDLRPIHRLGISVNGNRNWLYLGSSLLFRAGPAEFAKLAMIVWGADVLAQRKYRLLDQPKHLLVPFLPVSAVLILLVLFQGDAGTADSHGSHRCSACCGSSVPLVEFSLPWRQPASAGVIAIFVTSPVRMRRLLILDPNLDLNGANDQANAGMFAIASGGWWGVGLGASRQKWGSLSGGAHRLHIRCARRGVRPVRQPGHPCHDRRPRVRRHPDRDTRRRTLRTLRRGRYHCVVHGAGVDQPRSRPAATTPIAGVPLPLLSYGGSALIANLLAVGVLLACATAGNPRPANCWLRRQSGPGPG